MLKIRTRRPQIVAPVDSILNNRYKSLNEDDDLGLSDYGRDFNSDDSHFADSAWSDFFNDPIDPAHCNLIAHHDQAFLADRDGLVEMMLQQFSNPLLAFREIVQNSADEKSKSIDVIVENQTSSRGRRVIVSIEDNGAGMSLERIHQYLTLFDSSKEEDFETVGEMGVGKIFIFALKPEYVVIETGTSLKSEAYKVVINSDFSGRVVRASARKGTKITAVLNSRLCPIDLPSAQMIEESISSSCAYIRSRVTFNGKVLNKPFNLVAHAGLKYVLKDRDVQAVMALTGVYDHTYLKGRILLERAYRSARMNEDGSDSPLNKLEMLVDSYHFNPCISRNSVNRDGSYLMVMNKILDIARRFAVDLADNYGSFTRVDRNLVRNFLQTFIFYDAVNNTPVSYNLLNLPLFETADSEFVSYKDICAVGAAHRYIFYSTSRMSANEISLFKSEGIPVIVDGSFVISKHFSKFRGFGQYFVQGESHLSGFRREEYSAVGYESALVNTLLKSARQFYSFREKGISSSDDGMSVGGLVGQVGHFVSASDMVNGSGKKYLNTFDWGRIVRFRLEPFINLDGKPHQGSLLDVYRCGPEKIEVCLNANHPYFRDMVKLSEVNPQLSTYYMLCEVANSSSVFPDADASVVEDFILQIGLNLLGVTKK